MQDNKGQHPNFRVVVASAEWLFRWSCPLIFDKGDQYALDLDKRIARISWAGTDADRDLRLVVATDAIHRCAGMMEATAPATAMQSNRKPARKKG